MPKNLRIRTEVGVDKEITFELNQDFDMLEILSLKLHQTDVYPKNCSDFGVVVGRVVANGGFGVPNAKISIFIPLDKKDRENPIIHALYPYKTQNYRNEEGYRYNLLPSVPGYKGHVPTGNFPNLNEALLNQEVSYVYEKYYKYTAKTNESGDFMIYGVPTGEYTLVMNLDLSNMGCFSMVPEDFKLKGAAESDFNGASFKSSTNIDALPQIVTMSKALDVRPLWGDEDSGCGASIIRSDFDLRDAGVEITPNAVFMGSIATDTGKMSVNKNCRPRRKQGELCSLTPLPGQIESIRFTPFFEKEAPPGGGPEEFIPILQRFDINGGYTIDDNGAFLINIPMNLDYLITNEFGEQQYSQDPTVGIPTKAKYRFRIKPLESKGTARLRRRGSYLVPNIKEYNTDSNGNEGGINQKSYAFSVNYWDYPSAAIANGDIIAAKDYFYEFSHGKVYTPSVFHNHWKHRAKKQFIGVKEIEPREEKSCDGQALPFPVNTATKNINFNIIINQFVTRILQIFYVAYYFIMAIVCSFLMLIIKIVNFFTKIFRWFGCVICKARYWTSGARNSYCRCSNDCPCTAKYADDKSCADYLGCLFARVTKYPECEKCGCFTSANGGGCKEGDGCDNGKRCDDSPNRWGNEKGNDFINCSSPTNPDKDLEDGCYALPFKTLIKAIGDTFNGDGGAIGSIADWRKREVLFRSMCDGLMNYSWSNNWVGGFLYLFQFKAKLKPKEGAPNGYKVKHCGEVVYFHVVDQEFYYRSAPYKQGVGFVGDDDTALRSNRLPEGANKRNLHFPTTIMDLGPVIENIGDICYEKGYREGCSISDDIGATTFHEIGDFMFDAVNEIVNYNSGLFNSISLKTPFQRDATGPGRRRELNGGMASLLSQFSEVGVIGYQPPGEEETEYLGSPCALCTSSIYDVLNLGWDYPPPGGKTKPGGSGPNMWELGWPDTSSGGYFANPWSNGTFLSAWDYPSLGWWKTVSVSVPGGSGGQDDSVEAIPQLYSGTTEIQSGVDVRECIVEILNQTSQVVPFYAWDKNGSGFGTDQYEEADWRTGNGEIATGNIQKMSTWSFTPAGGGLTQLHSTPIDSNSSRYVALGTGYHYYFGLIPGATSYDIFEEKYVPKPQEDEEEFVI